MGSIIAYSEYAAVDLGVDCFHPAVQNFRELRVFRDVFYTYADIAQGLRCAAGGEYFDACIRQEFS